jgi:hypothetical protein
MVLLLLQAHWHDELGLVRSFYFLALAPLGFCIAASLFGTLRSVFAAIIAAIPVLAVSCGAWSLEHRGVSQQNMNMEALDQRVLVVGRPSPWACFVPIIKP